MKRLLLIFMKAPEPGWCKTRLCPPLEAGQAAALYRAFCTDTLRMARGVGVPLRIAYAPSDAFPTPTWLGAQTPPSFVQVGSDLGARLVHAFDVAFEEGHEGVIVIGADIPTLAPQRVADAFLALEANEAVFGPAADGGYYLAGLTRPRPELFADISWSTSRVMAQTRAAAERHGISPALVGEEWDIDTVDDLRRLARDRVDAPATRAALAEPAIRQALGYPPSSA